MHDDAAKMPSGDVRGGERLELAALWSRALSGAIDLVLIGCAMSVQLGVLLSLGARNGGVAGVANGDKHGLVVLGIAWLLIAVVGLAACWRTLGASPGGMLLGCQVVDARTRDRIGWGRALLRAASLVPVLLPLALGWLAAARDPRRRGWHDRIAGTEVVIEDESRSSLDDWLNRCP